jgi:hypothetical protein
MILDEERKETMLNFRRILKHSIRIMRRSPILCLGLLLIASVSGLADPAQPNDGGPDLEIPIRIDPRISSGTYGCTIVMAALKGFVLAGNNEDRNHPQTIVTFIPAKDKYYGRIVFGYDDAPVQGGMNDQGLFVDGNALAPTGWKPDPNKPMIAGNIMMVMLATCATCEDVKAVFEKSNVPGLGQARFPVADRSGASMVVEYGQGRVQFVRSDSWYQIATNFVMSNVKDGNYPCWRYRTADRILSGAKELSVDIIRDVLEKTHQEDNSLTVYSNIYDLKKGTVYIYNLRNFDEVVVMDLAEELKKGQRRIELPSLFKHAQEAVSTPENEIPLFRGCAARRPHPIF